MRQAFPSASSQAHAAPVMLPKPAPPQDVELGFLDHIIQRANTNAPAAASPRVAGAGAGAGAGAVAAVAPVAGMPPQQIARLQYGADASGGGAAGSRAASSA